MLTLLLLCACAQPESENFDATGIRFLSQMPEGQTFEQAVSPRVFEFPRDHGPHSGFATEWWYFTGNLRIRRRTPLWI